MRPFDERLGRTRQKFRLAHSGFSSMPLAAGLISMLPRAVMVRCMFRRGNLSVEIKKQRAILVDAIVLLESTGWMALI